MRRSIDLGGIWQIAATEGLHGSPDQVRLWEVDEARYTPTPVPHEVHQSLEESGVLPDLNLGTNTLAARWVEEHWWLYRRWFDLDAGDRIDLPAWLVFEGLDYQAIIYLNGEEVGRHANAHRPCRLEVSGRLRPGRNLLAVAVESGLQYVADRPGADYNPELFHTTKRHWLRKAQYQAGWDWHPRLLNVGITGAVRLEIADEPSLGTIVVLPTLADDHAHASLAVRAFLHNPGSTEDYTVRIRVVDTGAEAVITAPLPPGEHAVTATLELADPALWWPRGHGAQTRYTVEVMLERVGMELDRQVQRTGIRSVRITQNPHPVAGRYCIIEVNGRPIFCKGGNWVPPDLIPSRVTRERLAELVDLACAANFNFLRIWGGGVYAGHDFLELCDEAGILVWHDLPFACSKYPGDDPTFLAEVRAEVTWAVREFGSHPSLIIWCGNNEQEWGAWEWGYDLAGKSLPDYALYHHVIPVIMRQEDGSRPYWPSSPYSPDHQTPNDPLVGDQHPWQVGMPDRRYGADFWAYRTFVDRLPNEGGYLGASSPATLHQFLPGAERALRSPSWEHHDNSVNGWHPSSPITYQALRDWLGCEPNEMRLQDYAVASGLLQAEALTEYIANYRRRMFSSASAVFWMYNDSWPVTHGWTIVDYYLRKKLAYHPVRRAFAPVTVVVAEEGEQVTVFGVNDTPDEWRGALRFGVFTLAGEYLQDQSQRVTLPANASTPVATIDRSRWLEVGYTHAGAFALLSEGGELVAQHRLFLARFKDLALQTSTVAVSRSGDRARLCADHFVWGACLDVAGDTDVPDNAFDLLPGIPYDFDWPAANPDPAILQTGSSLVLVKRHRET